MLEKIFQKLNKIPSWVSIIALAIGCIVQGIPTILNFDVFMQEITTYIQGLSTSPVQVSATPGFKYLMAAIVIVINYFIIEGVAHLVYGWAVRYRYTNRGKKYYITSVRYGMAVVELVYGLYSLLSVWAPSVFYYSSDAVLFVLRTAVITFVYLGIKNECVNDKFVFSLYNRLFTIYFIYNGAIWLFDLFSVLLTSPIDVAYAIYAAVVLVIVALSAGLLYFTIYKKLKKEQEEARKIIILPPTSGMGGGNDSEIFRGYGL
ncbi:MAG: hypothetical protein IJ033_02730 [Clostridia bacterium]|nr:hypothetical protein [Clostridia bacterium]